jgi:hypothetical protein
MSSSLLNYSNIFKTFLKFSEQCKKTDSSDGSLQKTGFYEKRQRNRRWDWSLKDTSFVIAL